jgi:hypothetical protein
MKKAIIAVLAVMVLVIAGVGSASAANSLKQGTIGFGVDVNQDMMITGKYFVKNDMAVLAGFGLGINGNDGDGTNLGVMVGIRKYLKMDDFAPFVGGLIQYEDINAGVKNVKLETKTTFLGAQFGAEYFLHKQFSVEGSIAAGYQSVDQDQGGGSTTVSTLGTQRAGISFNFYF